jgi:GNAT superfamily N-acetyltransferase
MHVALRPAVASDRAFVEAVYFQTQRWLIERLFGWRGDVVEQAKFEETYSERESEIVVLDGADVGWLSVRRDAGGMDIEAIYLLPAAQKRGVGTKLVREVIKQARASGLPLTVSTAKINPARSLYERLGFVAMHESEFKVFMELR